MGLLKQSTNRNRLIFMADSSDHVTGKEGLTLTITASKDGAAFASISPTVTERGDGWYSLALTTSHTDTLGDFGLHIEATGADPTDAIDQVVAALPGEVTDATVTAAVLAGVVEGAYTIQDMLRLMAAVLLGKVTGGGTATNTFRDTGDSTDRVIATVDASGNRSAVTLDAS